MTYSAADVLTIVGEAPAGYGQEALPALEGLVGKRLANMMGLTLGAYLEHPLIRRKNVFEIPDEAKPWDYKRAYYRAMQIMVAALPSSRIICLGTKVATAFNIVDIPVAEWKSTDTDDGPIWLARLPHPSGRNRVLNDPAARTQMAKFLYQALHARD